MRSGHTWPAKVEKHRETSQCDLDPNSSTLRAWEMALVKTGILVPICRGPLRLQVYRKQVTRPDAEADPRRPTDGALCHRAALADGEGQRGPLGAKRRAKMEGKTVFEKGKKLRTERSDATNGAKLALLVRSLEAIASNEELLVAPGITNKRDGLLWARLQVPKLGHDPNPKTDLYPCSKVRTY